MPRSRSAGSAWSVPSLTITAPTALPPDADALWELLALRPTGTIATSDVSGRAPSSSRYLRIAPLHIARTTSLSVVPLALPIAFSRSSGQSWAANRREPVIRLLMTVRGAYSESAEVSLRMPRRQRPDQRAGEAGRLGADRQRRAQCVQGQAERGVLRLAASSAARAAAVVLDGPGRRHVAAVRVGREHALDQPHRGDAVDQGVVHLGVHRDPAVPQALDQVDLPQRPLQGEPGAVQPPAELEQLADAARLRQGAVPDVVLDVELVVLGPEPLAGRGQRPRRPLEEQRRRLVVGQHLLVHVLDEAASRALRLVEQLETAHVHRLVAVLGEEETRSTSGPSVWASRALSLGGGVA